MFAAAFCLLLFSACAAAQVTELSEWMDAEITHFGGAQDGMDPAAPSFGTLEGACGYGAVPKDSWPYFSTAALGPGNPFASESARHGCGMCFEVACATGGGACKAGPGGAPLSVKVVVADSCPECGDAHLDVQAMAFNKLADASRGRLAVRYRRIECDPPADAQVSVLDFAGAGGFLRLNVQAVAGRGAVAAVAARGAGGSAWVDLTNSWGATWETSAAPAPPLSLRVTDDAGAHIVATGVDPPAGFSGGVAGQVKYGAGGAQFETAAAQAVKAFDGGSDDPMLVVGAGGAFGGGRRLLA